MAVYRYPFLSYIIFSCKIGGAMDLILDCNFTIRDANDHILRATHCEDWSRQEIEIESKEVTVPGTIIGNGVTLKQGFEVMLQRISPETEVIGDSTNNAAGKQPFYPSHVLEL